MTVMKHFEKNNYNQMLFLRINELIKMIRENIFYLRHIVATRIKLLVICGQRLIFVLKKKKNRLIFLRFLSFIFQYFSSMSFPAL